MLSILQDELVPASAIEEMLVERIAVSYWRFARLLRAEAAVIASRQEDLACDQANQALHGALSGAKVRMPSLDELGESLSEAIGDGPQLRQMMTGDYPELLQANDEQILVTAQGLLSEIVEKLAEEQKHLDAIQRDQCSVPPVADAFQFARYETPLERQLFRALDALERLQRLRHGEDVPPPLNVNIDATVTGSDAPEIEV